MKVVPLKSFFKSIKTWLNKMKSSFTNLYRIYVVFILFCNNNSNNDNNNNNNNININNNNNNNDNNNNKNYLPSKKKF